MCRIKGFHQRVPSLTADSKATDVCRIEAVVKELSPVEGFNVECSLDRGKKITATFGFRAGMLVTIDAAISHPAGSPISFSKVMDDVRWRIVCRVPYYRDSPRTAKQIEGFLTTLEGAYQKCLKSREPVNLERMSDEIKDAT